MTMACTGRCKHCSEGDHSSCTGHIDADAAENAIREICKNYEIESLMTFGGEPLRKSVLKMLLNNLCIIHII